MLLGHQIHQKKIKSLIFILNFRNTATDRQAVQSDVESEEENEEGDYTVYECPGLAPVSEIHMQCLTRIYIGFFFQFRNSQFHSMLLK